MEWRGGNGGRKVKMHIEGARASRSPGWCCFKGCAGHVCVIQVWTGHDCFFSHVLFVTQNNYGSDSKSTINEQLPKLGRGRALQVICPKNGILATLLCLSQSGRNRQKVQHIQFILRETRRGWFLLKNFALNLENILSRVEPRCFLRLPGCISVLSEKYIKAICWDKNYTRLGIWSLRSEIWLFNFLATAELPSSQHSNEGQMGNVMTTL